MNKANSVLIIDDNEDDVLILKTLLEKLNLCHDIYVKENGKEAIEFLEEYEENRAIYQDKFPPILIFLDINMPIMNGFEFIEIYDKKISEDFRYNCSIVVFFTSSPNPNDVDKAMSYPSVSKYITKPITVNYLKGAWSEIFNTTN